MNATRIERDLRTLEAILAARLAENEGPRPVELGSRTFDGSWLDELTGYVRATPEEYVVVLLALAPHVRPHMFTRLIAEHLPEGGDLPEFGGVRPENYRGVLPTGETALFVLGGDDLARRLEVQRLFSGDHWFARRHVLSVEPVRDGEPAMSGRLILDGEIVEELTTGAASVPRFSIEFPAEHLTTELEWDDLVLPPDTLRQIREIQNWVTHHWTLWHDWGMGRVLKPGYRALFYGPSGTGKTLTATLLGKQTERDVFRIDLSRVVSKYIGETEKNLARLFAKAENKEWILFFDEADALFGKRTDIRDAHDRYANQEVSYLLQRVESYDGLVILATNQRGNIDDAFLRRFQVSVQFPMPGEAERVRLWRKAFPDAMDVANDVNWLELARAFELTGAAILNVAQYCALESLADGSHRLDRGALESAILREFVKDGKIV